MKAWLINLDRCPERLDHMTAELGRLGIGFTRIAAVDGREMSEAERAAFAANADPERKSWMPGQIGCFLSHYHAWQAIAAGDDPYGLVLEDDMLFADAIRGVLADLAWLPKDYDVVRFEGSTTRVHLGPALAHPGGRALHRVRSTTWCAGAYLISRECARRLVALPASTWQPTDFFLFCLERSQVARGLKVYQFAPALAAQGKFQSNVASLFATDIEADKPLAQRLKDRLKARFGPKAILRFVRGYKFVGFAP